MKKISIRLLTASLAAIFIVGTAWGTPPTYTLTDLSQSVFPLNGEANAISDTGWVTGTMYNGNYPALGHEMFIWSSAGGLVDCGRLTNSTGRLLPYLNGSDHYSLALEANDAGLIVGTSAASELNSYSYTACLWQESGSTFTAYDLKSLVTNMPAGWTLTEARDINASGQIVGVMSYGYGENLVNHPFVLTPVPEPSMMVLLAIGAIGLLGGIWRRK